MTSQHRKLLLRTSAVISMAGLVVGSSLAVAPAHAATVTRDDSTLRYTARPGEVNEITLTAEGRVLVIRDTGAPPPRTLPRGCVQDSGSATLALRCDAPRPLVLRLDLGDEADRLEAEPLPRRFTLRAYGGDGDDLVAPGDGDDRIVGGPGNDTLYGGYGDDTVSGGEGDNYVRGNDGDDHLSAGSGIDFVIGDEGDDVLRGGDELDFLSAGTGDDVVYAGGGPDSIDLDEGHDTAYAGAGNDDVLAQDGERDRIDCGAGDEDIAEVDLSRLDRVSRSCEGRQQGRPRRLTAALRRARPRRSGSRLGRDSARSSVDRAQPAVTSGRVTRVVVERAEGTTG